MNGHAYDFKGGQWSEPSMMRCKKNLLSATDNLGNEYLNGTKFYGHGYSVHDGNNPGGASNMTSRTYKPYSRMIMLETKMDCREYTPYTNSEIATHITALASKWGLPLAYRWITITNTGSTNLYFQRLGFYGSHAEAYADSNGDAIDTKSSAYLNVMKNYTGTSPYAVSIHPDSTGYYSTFMPSVTALMSNTGTNAPPNNFSGFKINANGGYIKIDLGDPITCSHIRFGNFRATSASNVRLKITLTTTKFADETEGISYECKVKAAKNASGPAEGQFPLHYTPTLTPRPIETSTDTFLNSDGSHINGCGIYVLVPNYATLVSGF